MDNPLVALIVILASIATLVAYFMVVWALLPRFTQEVETILHTAPGRSLWIGLVNFLFLGSAIAVCLGLIESGAQIFTVPAAILLAILVSGLSVGLAAFSRKIGQSLWAHRTDPWQLGAGSLTLILASLLPFVGWFLLFPVLAIMSLGAAFMNALAHFQPRRNREPAEKMPDPLE